MGLLRTAGRAAVASSVHGRVQRRQQQRWATQEAPVQAAPVQAAPAPAAPVQAAPVQAAPVQAAAPSLSTEDMLTQLTKLGELRDAGVLSDVEFEQQKARILGA